MDTLFPATVWRAAGAVAARVSLDSVQICEASFRCNQGMHKLLEVPIDSLKYSTKSGGYRFVAEENVLFVDIEFGVALNAKSADGPSFEIKASYLTTYRLTTNPPPEELMEFFFGSFAKANTLLNVWPYWREFASSCNSRMGLPQWNLPVLKLGPEPPPKVLDAKSRKKMATASSNEKKPGQKIKSK